MFTKRADESLQKEEPSSDEILRLLEDSTEFDLDLPQVPMLHQVIFLFPHLLKLVKELLIVLLLLLILPFFDTKALLEIKFTLRVDT